MFIFGLAFVLCNTINLYIVPSCTRIQWCKIRLLNQEKNLIQGITDIRQKRISIQRHKLGCGCRVYITIKERQGYHT